MGQHNPDDAVDIENNAELTDLAELDRNLAGFAAVADHTGLDTVGDLRDAAFVGFMGDAREVRAVEFWDTWGGAKAEITLAPGALDPDMDTTLPVEKFAEQVARGDFTVVGN